MKSERLIATREKNALCDEALKKIALELTEKLRKSTTSTVAKARLRNLVRITLRCYKYPPDKQEGNPVSAAAC